MLWLRFSVYMKSPRYYYVLKTNTNLTDGTDMRDHELYCKQIALISRNIHNIMEIKNILYK